jgi:site-specific recombinase XerD
MSQLKGWWRLEEKFYYWLIEVKRSAPNTVKNYRDHLRALHERGGDILLLREYRQVESLILDVKLSRKWSDSTTFKSAVIASAYYHWAKREGIIEKNPMADGHSFKKSDCPKVDFFDWESITFQKLIKNPTNSVRTMAILHVLRSSGIRAGELCNLRQTDQVGRILSVDGKTGKRDAIIDEEALKWINIYREGLNLVYSGEWLFTDEDYQRKYTEHALWRHIHNLGAKLGIKAYPHMFRHSLAGQILQNGGDMMLAADMLGHKSLSMTKRYTHFTSTQRLKNYDKILQK